MEYETVETNKKQSFLKAFVFFLAGSFLLMLGTASSASDQEAFEAGRVLGRAMGAAFWPALIIGIWSRRSEKEFSWLKFGCIYAVFFVGCSALQTAGSNSQVISGAEGADPVVENLQVCQSSIPFRFRLPNLQFEPLPEANQKSRQIRVWVWQDDATGDRVMVQAMKNVVKSPEDFREFVGGIKSTIPETFRLELDRVKVGSLPYQADLRFTDSATYVIGDQRCLSTGADAADSWTVCIATMSTDSSTLQSARDSFSLSSC